MIIAVRDHRHLSVPYVDALINAGHTIVPMGEPADLAFTDDEDIDDYRLNTLDRYDIVALYPNGAAVNRVDTPHPHVRHVITTTDMMGVVDGLPHTACGFPWAEHLPYDEWDGDNDPAVIMCPSHGWSGPQAGITLDRYAAIAETVLVRHLGCLDTLPWPIHPSMRSLNGRRDTNITWHEADGTIDYRHDQYLDADLCLSAYGSSALLAMVLGVSTIIYEHDPTCTVPMPAPYRDKAWMEQWVGGPFDAKKFVDTMEALVVG